MEFLFCHLDARRYQLATLLHERLLSALTLYEGMVEVVPQIIGQELLLSHVGLEVRLNPQQQVVAEGCPGVPFSVGMNHLAVCRCIVSSGGIYNFPVNVLFDNIAWSCRTVVVEEVIAIDTVLGHIVDLKG